MYPRKDDPKGAAGALKCPLHLLPPHSIRETANVLKTGAEKYGPYNWRGSNVCASTYVGAMMRHLTSWWDGELIDPESGISHLAHVAASAMIVLDAQNFGTLNLDIPYKTEEPPAVDGVCDDCGYRLVRCGFTGVMLCENYLTEGNRI